MKNALPALALLLSCCGVHRGTLPAAPAPAPAAVADLLDEKGVSVGQATLRQEAGGVRIVVEFRGLPPGATTYTEEQTRRNFERVSRLVTPGEPLKSVLLRNPLDKEAGGSEWHGGGKHWRSQNDAEWQTLAAWVRGGRS